ncbi:hypothetical protein Poli38472_009703 [Pythium oligandrum]|uniref:Kinesin light chain n=1 Tax=Pythium oligandrum TaxID=41045 RepID=A0A8K1CGA5_PYTOL|nr:hypothetical protein Poli38472_009703 [Pythium oligandrum]|eukprot:TMW62210.1 hypothetical protein Poli38472_009703 [Pythium oligandrum]
MMLKRLTTQYASRTAATTHASRLARSASRSLIARSFSTSNDDGNTSESDSRPRVQVLRHDHKPTTNYVQVEQDIAGLQRAIRDAYSAGNFQDALEVGLECRDLVQSHFGESHPVYASTITNIALMYKNMGRMEDAIESYEHALRVYKESVGEHHASFATTLHNLGAVYQTMVHTVKGMERVNALHRAQDCFEESLKIRKLLLEPGHPDIGLSMTNLGIIHHHNKQSVMAIKVLNEAVELLQKRVGNQSTLTAMAMNNLAFVYKESRHFEPAIALYERVVAIRESKWGPEHHETIMARHNLAEAYRASGNEDKALEIQNQILEMFDVEETDPSSSR